MADPLFTHRDPITLMGLRFPNRLGLAAGLDKNGVAVDAFARMGFGFIEVGTVTPLAQPGNPKPRLFRLPEHQAIINRMGFNNHGIDALLNNLRRSAQQRDTLLGINLGKNKHTPNERALDDYLIGLNKAYPSADYLTINISSPNTAGLRDLQHGQALGDLLTGLKQAQTKAQEQHGRYVPLVVKIAPDNDDQALREMLTIISDSGIDGIIATNTTLDKSRVRTHKYADQEGGLSGAPLTEHSTQIIHSIRGQLPDIALIAAGGVMSATDYQDKLAAGADLVQVYSGLIYHGPRLVRECLQAAKT
ncbi:quinone-dependent dihydroorotate dehydrogenase [Suttonella sp. R2A3]|nr:quinone-dependent dihydroorotate dehydrogenase [Suttonella sp. R2A3]UJF24930.1 quinone-dependent dihydroorotate dehydrogenase [Suttonella sp. R2A3]